MIFLYFLTVVLPTVTLQCAPHGASGPWTKTETYNNHHHHHKVENFFLDNRTIYNKIVEIEKRIDKIEEKENILPPPIEPQKPENPNPENPGNPGNPENSEKPIDEEKEETKATLPIKEDPGQDCLSCSSTLPILDTCETCVPVTVSPPFEYYACKAVEIKCGDGAKKFKISSGFQRNIVENQFMLECRKGHWVMMANHMENKVDTISCLKS